jgi:hypothetical protein
MPLLMMLCGLNPVVECDEPAKEAPSQYVLVFDQSKEVVIF